MALKDGSPEDYGGAALRHYMDAKRLHDAGRLDNAGHLIGFAAECAIKHRIKTLRPGTNSPELHLPYILPAARKQLGERSGFASMYHILKSDIFNKWAVDHRYSPDGKVTQELWDEWFQVAARLLGAAGIKVRLP